MKKTILILVILVILGFGAFLLNPFKNTQINPIFNEQTSNPAPSKTLKEYTDPSGFSFSYPDNLSLLNNELKGKDSYAELQLSANGVEGSLILKIADSKLKSIDEWVKENLTDLDTQKEASLGALKAKEITKKDKIILGALDQGVLFNIEIPLNKDKDFWIEVYNQVLKSFSFAFPPVETGSVEDITFEGEEVVE